MEMTQKVKVFLNKTELKVVDVYNEVSYTSTIQALMDHATDYIHSDENVLDLEEGEKIPEAITSIERASDILESRQIYIQKPYGIYDLQLGEWKDFDYYLNVNEKVLLEDYADTLRIESEWVERDVNDMTDEELVCELFEYDILPVPLEDIDYFLHYFDRY